ncbi:MAG: hypothetical protein WC749_15445 [Dehalococcoidia bacterium]
MNKNVRIRRDRAELWSVAFDRKDREILFAWFARTEVKNITWSFLLAFRLGWPPVEWFKGFVNNDNPSP